MAMRPSLLILFLFFISSELPRSRDVRDLWFRIILINSAWCFLPSIQLFYNFSEINLSLLAIPSDSAAKFKCKSFIDKSSCVISLSVLMILEIYSDELLPNPQSRKIHLLVEHQSQMTAEKRQSCLSIRLVLMFKSFCLAWKSLLHFLGSQYSSGQSICDLI